MHFTLDILNAFTTETHKLKSWAMTTQITKTLRISELNFQIKSIDTLITTLGEKHKTVQYLEKHY